MLTRILPAARQLQSVARYQAVRCMSSHTPAHWKSDREIAIEHSCTMDSMPIPAGSWQENYDKVNYKYNIYLAISSVVFVISMYMVKRTNAYYLHWRPDMKKIEQEMANE